MASITARLLLVFFVIAFLSRFFQSEDCSQGKRVWCVVYRPKNCGKRSKTGSNKLKVLIQESVVGVCKSIQHVYNLAVVTVFSRLDLNVLNF